MGFLLRKRRMILTVIISMFTLVICFVVSIYVISFLLGPPKLTNDQNTIYYNQTGEVFGEEKGTENRYWITIEEISTDVVNATIAVEDKNFYDHNGFDIKGILRAALSDLQTLSLKEGASTLTQQYARNLYLSHEKTWSRKIKEAFYTIRLEMYYSKEEILEGYLNTIYFGHGAYGIEAASKYFYDKRASELTLGEAAMLAAIPKGPTYYSPLNDQEKAKERQKRILSLMVDQQVISEEASFLATREKLTYKKEDAQKKEGIAPYFQDTVLKEAAKILQLDTEFIKSNGYKIHTTLNSDLQKLLKKKMAMGMKKSSNIEIGAIAMDPYNGGIQALVGGRSYEKSPFNRAISAKRMAGSTFKPFLYYTALANGYTASTRLMSKPTTFVLEDDDVYQPSNFNGYYANKPITLAQALALSDNVYAVKTNLFLGVDKLAETASDLGVTSELPLVPSLALGTASVSVEEMVTAYGIIANGGQEIEGHTIEKIVDRNDEVVFERKDAGNNQLLDSANAFILTHLMTGMFDSTLNGYMAVTGSTIANKLTRTYAGKSGTTRSDSWMIGYSPSLVTGIWTGYDNNQPIETAREVAYAKDIWADFMEAAHQDMPKEGFPVPPEVVRVQVDPANGQIATPYCPSRLTMYFKKGTEPKSHCETHFPREDIEKDVQEEDEEKGILQRLFDLFR